VDKPKQGLFIRQPKILMIKLIIVGLPTYSAALLTNKMVYVVPMLAVALLFGSNLNEGSTDETDADFEADT
jgi:hypothetical protein